MRDKYVILGQYPNITHFAYDSKTNKVHCTHGGWGGLLIINNNNTCYVDTGSGSTVDYDKYEFTQANSFDTAFLLKEE
jgi:hypothetical protein|tara:strand:+ start:537 stop:770 length:234 start_codon:yes stop_codon:yes gene_type:complete